METQPTTPEVVPVPVVVFGRDEKGKPHASRFDPADAELAEKAAGLMGMRVLRVASDEHATLAGELPAGKIFTSGRGLVPFCKSELYARLEAAPEAYEPAAPTTPADATASALGVAAAGVLAEAGADAPGEPDAAADGPSAPPVDWAGVVVGSMVLAAEEGKPGIWYPATVVAERGDHMFELRWFEDGDELPLIVRRREHVGLFPAAVIEALV